MKTKTKDLNILALKKAVAALKLSTSRQMLKANLDYLYDAFITHPAKETEEYFKQKETEQKDQ